MPESKKLRPALLSMDPLSALSVAAAVVQFVDFGIEILVKGKELYESANGALSENIPIQAASERLQSLAGDLQTSLSHSRQVSSPQLMFSDWQPQTS